MENVYKIKIWSRLEQIGLGIRLWKRKQGEETLGFSSVNFQYSFKYLAWDLEVISKLEMENMMDVN